MNVHYVDYSELWFRQIQKGDLPAVRSGKFILVANGSSRWAVFSPAELSRLHATIAERFFASQGVPGSYHPATKKFLHNGQEWRILGGGLWHCDSDAGTLRIYGTSTAYGSVDLEALAESLEKTAGWKEVLPG
ncbi:MAG: hypothetical protein WC869_02105 [Phycisphaerae bacterium]